MSQEKMSSLAASLRLSRVVDFMGTSPLNCFAVIHYLHAAV